VGKGSAARADSFPSDVADCCKLLHTPASEQNLLQTVHKLLHSVAASWSWFTSCWRLDGSTTIFSTSYDSFSTYFDTIDNFRQISTLRSPHNAQKRGLEAQNIGSGT
jgi:hypothetical protein